MTCHARPRVGRSSTTVRATSARRSGRWSGPARDVDGDGGLRRRAGRPTGWSCPASARSRPAWPGCATVRRRPGDRPAAGRRPPGARHLRRHAGAVRGGRRARRRRPTGCGPVAGHGGAARRAGAAAHGLEHGDRAGRARCCSPGSTPGTRFYFVHSYAAAVTRRRQLAAAAPLVTWAEHGEPFVAAVENGPLCGDAVPPREVRRRRRRAAGQLAGDALVTAADRCCPPSTSPRRQAVRLVQGAAGSETSYGDPLEAALAWQRAGRRVDPPGRPRRRVRPRLERGPARRRGRARLDVAGRAVRRHPRRRLARRARSATGCARVNIGTAALENPDWVRSVIARHGERIAVGLDVRGTTLAARGWTAGGRRAVRDAGPAGRRGLRPVRGHRRAQGRHAARPEPGPAPRRLRAHRPRRWSPAAACPAWPTCGRSRRWSRSGVEGAIVGKALYAGAFTLEEALAEVAAR